MKINFSKIEKFISCNQSKKKVLIFPPKDINDSFLAKRMYSENKVRIAQIKDIEKSVLSNKVVIDMELKKKLQVFM